MLLLVRTESDTADGSEMVKTYLRYELTDSFGVITSNGSNALFDRTGKLAITACLENVCVWNIKQASIAAVLKSGENNKSEVTCIRTSPDGLHVAVGFDDGKIKVFHIPSKSVVRNLNGHRSGVTSIRYNRAGTQIVSGSKDTDIIVWDAVGEVGLFRLRGHKDMITDCLFLELNGHNHLISSSKDTFIKIWSLDTQHCIQTLIGHRNAVWSIDVDHSETRLVSGSTESELRVWKLIGANRSAAVDGDDTASTADGDSAMTDSKHSSASAAAANAKPNSKKRKSEAAAADEADGLDVKGMPKIKSEPIAANGSGSDSASAEAAALIAAAAGPDEIAVLFGVLPRKSTYRVQTIRFNPRATLLACQAVDKSIELWKIRSADDVTKKLKRREKRQREKKSKELAAAATTGSVTKKEKQQQKEKEKEKEKEVDMEDDDNEKDDASSSSHVVVVSDEFESVLPLRTTKKVRSFCFSPVPVHPSNSAAAAASATAGTIDDRILLSLTDNSVVVYDLKVTPAHADSTYSVSSALELAGHRSGIRSVALSADDSLLLSTSSENIKVWNVSSKQCIRTLESGYGLCGVFVPGDRHVIVGTKTGHIEVWELGSASCVQKIEAHSDSIWSMDLRPDGRGLITGSADKEVKGWDFELVSIVPASDSKQPTAAAPKQLQLVHTRTLKLTDQVLCVRHSPNGKYIAVGLLDCTIKVFYEDSMKFFLSMYGHKLPVLSIDISSDSTLLISGSADKNVKIWGLDFGDLHKSFFAHHDSVMKYVPPTTTTTTTPSFVPVSLTRYISLFVWMLM